MITMPQNQIKELVDTVYQQTEVGKIAWSRTYDKEVFECKLGKYVVRVVGHTPDDQPDTFFWLELRDETGEVIEIIHPYVIPGVPVAMGVLSYAGLFAALFDSARRSASGATNAIGDILSILKKA